jgi:hypothetical protein
MLYIFSVYICFTNDIGTHLGDWWWGPGKNNHICHQSCIGWDPICPRTKPSSGWLSPDPVMCETMYPLVWKPEWSRRTSVCLPRNLTWPIQSVSQSAPPCNLLDFNISHFYRIFIVCRTHSSCMYRNYPRWLRYTELRGQYHYTFPL